MSRQRTTSFTTTVAKGLVAAGEYGVTIIPRGWRADGSSTAAIYAPALSAGGWNVTGFFVVYELARRGIAVVSSDLSDTPQVFQGSGLNSTVGGTGNGGPGVWGNDTSMTRLDALYTYARNVLGAAPKVIGLGGSQGGATMSRWAAYNQAKLWCVALGIPAVDIQDVLTNNPTTPEAPSGFRQSVQTAWGLGAGMTVPASSSGASPNLPARGIDCAPLYTVPVRVDYSTDDPICRKATQDAFAAANPSVIASSAFGSVGHSTTGFPNAAVADWCLARVP